MVHRVAYWKLKERSPGRPIYGAKQTGLAGRFPIYDQLRIPSLLLQRKGPENQHSEAGGCQQKRNEKLRHKVFHQLVLRHDTLFLQWMLRRSTELLQALLHGSIVRPRDA